MSDALSRRMYQEDIANFFDLFIRNAESVGIKKADVYRWAVRKIALEAIKDVTPAGTIPDLRLVEELNDKLMQTVFRYLEGVEAARTPTAESLESPV